ncbi:hypothetical protein AX16_004863 [Volvariella volvacea WC 439]|nr:hypothetical protein AX16_004863 [Volvariella volvacea WC 439]
MPLLDFNAAALTTATGTAIASPWKLKGKSWIFTLSGLSPTSSFPAGFAAPYEAEALSSGGTFVGGPSSVQLVSYTESPVDNELIYLPGRWQYPDGSSSFRITRIFVSTKESTYNGRKNWNIPKQVADFDFKTGSDGITRLTVSLPGSSTPFFKATVSPIPLVSSLKIPFTTTILGKYYGLKQPPLPAGPNPEEVGTTEWAALVPVMKGWSYFASVSAEMDGGKLGDGVQFPAVASWRVAMCLEGLDLDFGVATLTNGP